MCHLWYSLLHPTSLEFSLLDPIKLPSHMNTTRTFFSRLVLDCLGCGLKNAWGTCLQPSAVHLSPACSSQHFTAKLSVWLQSLFNLFVFIQIDKWSKREVTRNRWMTRSRVFWASCLHWKACQQAGRAKCRAQT